MTLFHSSFQALVRALGPLLVGLVMLLALPGPLAQTPQEPAPPVEEQGKKSDDAEEAREDEVREIEVASQEPWLRKWKRFRKATRDITEWNFKNGMFRMRFGMRFQIDGTYAMLSSGLEDQVGKANNGVSMRRARLFADGDFLRRFHFRFEYDFGVDRGLKDAYVDGLFSGVFKQVAAVKVGNFREPFSIERRTSSNFDGFMEFSLPVATFAPGRSLGIAIHGTNVKQRIHWEAGAFTVGSQTDDNRNSSDLTLSARISGLPLHKPDQRKLVHLGISYSGRKPADNVVQYATRPEAREAPFFIDTGDIAADTVHLFGVEGAAVHGPFWIQGEYILARPDSTDLGNLSFDGAYAQVGWFLTGESRVYLHREGAFGRLDPARSWRRGGNPFKKNSQGGAVELVGRISTSDLDDGVIQAGKMRDFSFGANWYVTRATMLRLNYVRSRIDDGSHANIFLLRYQFNPGYHWPLLTPKHSGPLGL